MSSNELKEEKDLIAKASNGDREAFRFLVERYQSRLFSLAYALLGSREDAEDIVQESFVKAYLALRSFKGESSFYTWLYRIAYNMSLDFKRRLDRERTQVLDEAVLNLKAEGDPQRDLLRRERESFFKTALAEIGEEHRAVILLREVDGLSYEDIAKSIGISRGTVMSRLFYARQNLKRILTRLLGSKEDGKAQEPGLSFNAVME